MAGTGNGLETFDDDLKCSDFSMSDADAVVERPLEILQASESSENLKFPSKLVSVVILFAIGRLE